MFHVGCRFDEMSPFVPTIPCGNRLIRLAPDRMLYAWAGDSAPDRLLRTLPASLTVPSSRKRGGGAKSRAVNVPDLRNAWLTDTVSFKYVKRKRKRDTYGLGMTARSSYDDTSGECAGTAGLYGRRPPCGVPGRPARRSRAPRPGA